MASWVHQAKTISLKSVDICRAAISGTHKFPTGASYILKDQTHILNYRTKLRYEGITSGTIDREKEGLWLIAGANTVQRTRVVRSWARRRVMHAIVQQLKAVGFDRNGRKLKEARDHKVIHDGHIIESLIGIVDISLHEKSIQCKYEEIMRQAGLLVQEILTRCGQWKGSPSIIQSTKPRGGVRKTRPPKGLAIKKTNFKDWT